MRKTRGQVTATLGGKSYVLLPTYEAMAEFERIVDATAYEALRYIVENKSAPIRFMAAAFYVGIKAAWDESTNAPTLAELGQMLRDDGMMSHLNEYSKFITNSLTSASELDRIEALNGDQGK